MFQLKSLFSCFHSRKPGEIIIKEEASADFSRLFAKAMLDTAVVDLLADLLKVSGAEFSWREMAILKYVLGEEDNEYIAQMIEEMGEAMKGNEPSILLRQMQILQNWCSEHSERFQSSVPTHTPNIPTCT